MICVESSNALLLKVQDLEAWTEGELHLLTTLGTRRRRFEAHQTIIHEGDPVSELFVVQEGWACVHKLLPTGARQIIGFPLPGDIVGLSDIMAERATASLESLTEVVVSPVSASLIKGMLASPGPVGRALSRCLEQNIAITVEHLVNTGRRSALARTAHLILEFAARLRLIGVKIDESFELPVSQNCLADALGLTGIHVNRVLRQLRESRLLTMKSGIVTIHDWDALADLASFSPDYLGFRRPKPEREMYPPRPHAV